MAQGHKAMNQQATEKFLMDLANVEQEDNFGYLFFFVGDDHRFAFVTIGYADNEFDKVSNLDREGIFRINIGVSKQTYRSLLADVDPDGVDYAALDVFMPHPHYAKQHFVSILNPTGANVATTQKLMLEAHTMAQVRADKKAKQ
jgi:hypothetical protein